MNPIRSLFILILLVAWSHPYSAARAGNPHPGHEQLLESRLNQTMAALYTFNFPLADSLSLEILQVNPQHYISHFARASYLWWMIITHPDDPALGKQYATSIALAQEHLPRGEEQPGLTATFYHISIYAMEAQMSLRKKEYLRTMVDLRKCAPQVEYSKGKEQQHAGFLLTSGLYNYMMGYARKRFPALGMFKEMFPMGGMQQGLDQLHRAAHSSNMTWKTEARFLLMKIYLEMEKQPLVALEYVNWLTDTYPANLIYHHYHYMICKAMKDDEGMAAVKARIKKLALAHQGMSQSQRDYFIELAAH